jgi:hypothetical protein
VRAVNGIGDDGAASLAPSLLGMPQLTSLDLGGTLRASAASCTVSGWLRTPAVHGVMLRAAGWGVCARGCSWCGGGSGEGWTEGRRCVQRIGSEQLGQRRWHRVS